MPTFEAVDEDIPLSEQIRLAQASGLFAQPSARRRSTAGQRRDAPLVAKIPAEIDGAELVEVDYTDVDGIPTHEREGMERVGQRDKQPELDIWDEIFFASLYVIPLSSLFLLLDILAHKQYNRHPHFDDYASRLLQAVPTLSLIVWASNRYAANRVTNPVLMTASILSGARLIWLVNKAPYVHVMQQAPPVGTLWIFTVVQLSVGRAVISLVAVLVWCWRNGMKFQP